MNSLLSMFGNSLLNGGNDSQQNSGVDGIVVLLQAVGAAMRGENPNLFMKKLANSYPPLKKMNLDDLMGSAQQLANQRGVEVDDVKRRIDKTIDPLDRR